MSADPCEVVVPGAVTGNREEAQVLVGQKELHLLVEVWLVVGQVVFLDKGEVVVLDMRDRFLSWTRQGTSCQKWRRLNREVQVGSYQGRGLYFPAKLQNNWGAFGDICQLSGTWMAPNSILIETNYHIF